MIRLTPAALLALLLALSAHAAFAQAEEEDSTEVSEPAEAPAKPTKPQKTEKAEAPAPAGDNYTMLKINGQDVSRADVLDLWQSMFEGRPAPDFDGVDPKIKQNVLSGIASETVVYQQALKDKLDEDAGVKRKLAMLKKQILIQEYVGRHTKDKLSEDALRARYEAEQSKAGAQEEVQVRHILLKNQDEARRAYERLKKGDDFAAVAREMSAEKGSATSGGELGWIGRGYAVPEFVDAALKLRKGQYSKPVKTALGWHIIQVEDRRQKAALPFDQARDKVASDALSAATRQLVEKLLKEADIQYLGPDGTRLPFDRNLPADPAAH